MHLRPFGSYISGSRGTAAVGAGALEPSVNELTDTTFGCSILAQKPPVLCPKERHRLARMHLAAALLMHFKRCNFRPPMVRLAPLFVLGGSWMGLQALFRIATGRHERYTAPAGVWPAAGPEAAGTSAAQ